MDRLRFGVLRDWIALVIVFVAVPFSVFGGMNLACVGQALTPSCEADVVIVSPLLLVLAGIAAGLVTRGWTGLFVVGAGQIAGQVAIVGLAYLAGRPVPIDLWSGIIATVWFGVPIAIGYGLARGGTNLLAAWRGDASPPG